MAGGSRRVIAVSLDDHRIARKAGDELARGNGPRARRSRRTTRGATYLEYLISIGLIAILCMAAYRLFGRGLHDAQCRATSQLRTLNGEAALDCGPAVGLFGERPASGAAELEAPRVVVQQINDQPLGLPGESLAKGLAQAAPPAPRVVQQIENSSHQASPAPGPRPAGNPRSGGTRVASNAEPPLATPAPSPPAPAAAPPPAAPPAPPAPAALPPPAVAPPSAKTCGFGCNAWGVVTGPVGGLWDDVTGLVTTPYKAGRALLADPKQALSDAANTVKYVAQHPLDTAGQLVWDTESRQAWKEGNYAQAVTRTAWNVGSSFIPVGGVIGKVSKGAKILDKAGDAAKLLNAAEKAEKAEKGLEAGKDISKIAQGVDKAEDVAKGVDKAQDGSKATQRANEAADSTQAVKGTEPARLGFCRSWNIHETLLERRRQERRWPHETP
jgi:hypothetical protein